MAPQTVVVSSNDSVQQKLNESVKSVLDCNRNEVTSTQKAPQLAGKKKRVIIGSGDFNERSRKLIGSCFGHLDTNLNVFVIGSNNSGKSSLINSMNMAFHQEWTDRAKYCPGRHHVVSECIMYRNRTCGSKVVFWDTRGFEDIHEDDHAILILRYFLEGRIPSKCIPCVLLMSKELIKKRYHRAIDRQRRIDVVLYVSDVTKKPNEHLMDLVEKAVTTSKYTFVQNIPIISVVTKADVLFDCPPSIERLNEYSLDHLRCERRQYSSTKPDIGPHAVIAVDNYKCELEPFSDESLNPSAVQSCPQRDEKMLLIWKEIVSLSPACGGGVMRKRAYSSGGPSRRPFGCLPFRFNYSRIRSASF